ncbi:MAG: ComF family protein [Propionibacteriaceae bacterium]|nr:ComF family protein [Propionibacteriaceae bacterium]
MLDAAADLLLGGNCLGCGAAGLWLCASCEAELGVCVPVRVSRPGFPEPIWAAGPYRGALKGLIPAYKDAQALHLARPLGRLLASCVSRLGAGALLVPLPSSPGAVRRRGDDHMRRLVRKAASWLDPEPRLAVALRARAHGDQAELSAGARQGNLAHTMSAAPGCGDVIVCDDIVTTGASLAEARRALLEAGYRVRGAAVIAHTPRRCDL